MGEASGGLATARGEAQAVAAREISARELVERALRGIAAVDRRLNAFSAVLPDAALAEARALDELQAGGELRGPLHGVPVAIKDEDDVAGVPTTYGGAAFTTPASADSEVVRRLRAAGAIIVGKTRMPEFAIWPFTETSANGYTRNPWNPLRSTAGSSGGSAAAVASGMVAVGIGGDCGGSIRLPSSYCGLFGLKCQRGRTSCAPHANLWRSLGVIGPLARTVADSALVYDAIAGSTPRDQWRAEPLGESLVQAAANEPPALRIALSERNPMGGPAAEPQTLAALHALGDLLADLGHHVEPVDPHYPRMSLAFTSQVIAGVGEEAARAEHPRLLERRTREFLRLGRPLARLAPRGERIGIEAGRRFDATFFAHYDLLVTPTSPGPAVALGQLDGRGALEAGRIATAACSFTAIWNVFGNPAAAVPCGFSRGGLPLSAQLIGPANSEPRIVALAAQVERARPWTDRLPAVRVPA